MPRLKKQAPDAQYSNGNPNTGIAPGAMAASTKAAVAGGITVGAVDVKVIGTTTTVVLAADANRQYVRLTNLSAERIDVAVGAAAVLTKGIPLPSCTAATQPIAGVVELKGLMAGLAINAICTSGSMNLSVQTGSIA